MLYYLLWGCALKSNESLNDFQNDITQFKKSSTGLKQFIKKNGQKKSKIEKRIGK